MRVLSVDPGYDRLGVAVLEKSGNDQTLLYSGCFQTNKKNSYAKRILGVGDEIERLILKYKPEVLASESLFFTKNQKTVMGVAGSRGVIIYIAEKHGLKVFEYTPLQIKIAVTGYGRSDKLQVTQMVQKLIKVGKKVKFDDEYDAIAVGLTCFATEKALK